MLSALVDRCLPEPTEKFDLMDMVDLLDTFDLIDAFDTTEALDLALEGRERLPGVPMPWLEALDGRVSFYNDI